jgi:hypothetical protein
MTRGLRRRLSYFLRVDPSVLAALPRRLLAAQYEAVGEGEADEARSASQVWGHLGCRLR